MKNIDEKVVKGFGDEWTRFDQKELNGNELNSYFNQYFSIFPWELISQNSCGFDMGCGSGRWAKLVAPKVGILHCIDPSSAINVAKLNLKSFNNCVFHNSTTESFSVPDGSMDFGYSLGVLHHIPDTQLALNDCVKKLKIGAPFLVYLYYAFDNKPKWFYYLFLISDFFRNLISKCPKVMKFWLSNLIAIFIYLPLSRLSFLLNKFGVPVDNLPLSAYKDSSFYTMRTDALDRFGTQLEHRFTKVEIEKMMINSGLCNIKFNDSVPFWCAVGIKK